MKFIVLSFLLFTLSAQATELTMATIKSDIDKNTTLFLLEVDNAKDIHSIRILTTTPQGRIFEDFSYSAEEVLHGGVVLHERNGHKAVKLKVEENFSTVNGGGVILDYLYSGVTGTRRFLSLKLVRDEQGFKLQKVNGEPVNHFFFKGNWSPVLGVIGVREIVLSHQ